jgi:hypothetical protein
MAAELGIQVRDDCVLKQTFFGSSIASSVPMAQSDYSKRTGPDDRSFTFPDRSACADILEVPRFSCTMFPDVPGVFDFAEPSGHSRVAQRTGAAFPLTEKIGTQLHTFRSSIVQPASTSVYASL